MIRDSSEPRLIQPAGVLHIMLDMWVHTRVMHSIGDCDHELPWILEVRSSHRDLECPYPSPSSVSVSQYLTMKETSPAGVKIPYL